MRMRRVNLSRFALFKTTKISHSIFLEVKFSFSHDILCFTHKLKNPQWPIVAFLFCSVYYQGDRLRRRIHSDSDMTKVHIDFGQRK